MRLRPGTRHEKRRLSPRSKDWQNALRDLKTEFPRMGIQFCEFNFNGCWRNHSLGFSHKLKRRFYADKEGLKVDVVLACTHCHNLAENHPQKIKLHDEAIARRSENYLEAA